MCSFVVLTVPYLALRSSCSVRPHGRALGGRSSRIPHLVESASLARRRRDPWLPLLVCSDCPGMAFVCWRGARIRSVTSALLVSLRPVWWLLAFAVLSRATTLLATSTSAAVGWSSWSCSRQRRRRRADVRCALAQPPPQRACSRVRLSAPRRGARGEHTRHGVGARDARLGRDRARPAGALLIVACPRELGRGAPFA